MLFLVPGILSYPSTVYIILIICLLACLLAASNFNKIPITTMYVLYRGAGV